MEESNSILSLQLADTLLTIGALLIISSGLAFLLRLKRAGTHLLVLGSLTVVLGEIGPSIYSGVPFIILLLVSILIALNLFRIFIAVFIGRSAAASATGNLLANAIIAIVIPFLQPFKLLRRLFSRRRD